MRAADRFFEQRVRSQAPYFELLDRLHQHLVPRNYVEIGVSDGRSMTLSLPGCTSIGVDPEPKVQFPIRRSTQIFKETSDDFFAQHDVKRLLGGAPVDFAFIDGMHHFEFALRDFMNIERLSSPDTTIVIHDCLPIDEVTASRDRTTNVWSGDIWRLIMLLLDERPDLDVVVVDVEPTGLGLVRNLDPSSTVLADRYQEFVDRYLAIPYAELEAAGKATRLNTIANNWDGVRQHLPDRPFRRANVETLKTRRAMGSAGHKLRKRIRSAGPSGPHRPAPAGAAAGPADG